MSLIAIRHGQASYAAADYDQLSDAGYEQSRRLGRWLLQHAPLPERVLVLARGRWPLGQQLVPQSRLLERIVC